MCSKYKMQTIKVYTASGWPFRQNVTEINQELRNKGLNVISTWVEEENGINTPEDFAKDAFRDTRQVSEADVLLAVMNDDKYVYRGTWTEIGVGIALQKEIILVCAGYGQEKKISETHYEYPYYCMNNVFFWHPAITRVKTLEEAINILTRQ